MSATAASQPSRAFSLTELLVVIAIIAVLGSLLLSAIPLVKGMARKAQCASNLRNIGTALLVYTEDNSGNFPRHDAGDPSSWPYNFEDWAIQDSQWKPGTNFYEDYFPADRRSYYCPEGQFHQQDSQSYPNFPGNPTPPLYATLINYTYFAGTSNASTPGNSRAGPRGTWDARAKSTLISDVMRFNGVAPFDLTSGHTWNHRGTMSTDSSVRITDRSGGNMFHFDGHVSWISGLSELLKHRQRMKGNDNRSYCAVQKNDLQ